MSDNTLPIEALRGLYEDIELAILFDWLGRERPPTLAGIDTEATIQPYSGPDGPGSVHLHEGYDRYDYGHDTRLANEVVRLALNAIAIAIATRLPQWAAVSKAGGSLGHRARRRAGRGRDR